MNTRVSFVFGTFTTSENVPASPRSRSQLGTRSNLIAASSGDGFIGVRLRFCGVEPAPAPGVCAIWLGGAASGVALPVFDGGEPDGVAGEPFDGVEPVVPVDGVEPVVPVDGVPAVVDGVEPPVDGVEPVVPVDGAADATAVAFAPLPPAGAVAAMLAGSTFCFASSA